MKQRRHVALSSTLPFMSPHLATASLHPASPHQIEAPRQTHMYFIPRGGGWLSQSAHLPRCFYYDSHLSLPPIAHLSSPDSEESRCHDTSFYSKRVERYLCHTRGFTYIAEGYSGVIDVLAGVMTQEVRLTHFEKVCVCVGAHNISKLLHSQRKWKEIFVPRRDSELHNKSPYLTWHILAYVLLSRSRSTSLTNCISLWGYTSTSSV